MTNSFRLAVFATAAATVALITSVAVADVSPGLLSDFQSGTTEGWAGGADPTHVADGGPSGPGDSFLQIGNGFNLATFNQGLSGVLDSAVAEIGVDLMRPAGEPDLDMRLVLFGPGSGQLAGQWTSSVASVVPGDGTWNTYSFSVREADLTMVVGGSVTYPQLLADLDRIMFRYDPGTPSSRGTPVDGTLALDNITAIASAPVPGDYDGNGTVGSEDYTAWVNAYSSTVTAGQGADGNSDGVIDAADYTVWRDLNTAGSSAVPEASTLALLLAAGCVTARRRTSQRLILNAGRAGSPSRSGSRPPR